MKSPHQTSTRTGSSLRRGLRCARTLALACAGLASSWASAATVAYYRYEGGTVGATINPLVDSAGTTNMTPTLTPLYDAGVPRATLPLNGIANLGCGNYGAGNQFHFAANNSALAGTAFQDITIECYVKFNSLGGWQTFIGRDDSGAPGQSPNPSSLLYFAKSGANNGFRIELWTATTTNLQVNSTFVPVIGTWYHVAAVGNKTAGTLTLYVDGTPVGSTTGFTGLFVPTAGSDTPWTIGRGEYNNAAGDYFDGFIDEVRFSDTALTPSQFLNYDIAGALSFTQQPAAVTGSVGQTVTLSVLATGATSFAWEKSTNGGGTWTPVPGATSDTLTISSAPYSANGLYRCVASNVGGSLTSNSVAVTLAYPTPTITAGSNSSTVLEGTDVTLSVTAAGVGTLSYAWTFNGSPVGTNSPTLPLTAISGAAAGTYVVTVTDPAGIADGFAATTTTRTIVLGVINSATATVGYYRFEDGSNGANIGLATDSAGDSPLVPVGTPTFTSNVAGATVPRTGASNTLAANFPVSGANGLAAPASGTLASAAFTDFTIETYMRVTSLAGWQTIIGRDDTGNPGQGNGAVALFYLSKSGANNGLRAEVMTKDNTNIQINSSFVPSVDSYYHVALVGNALTGTMTLYVDGVSVGSTTGFTGLFVPTTGSAALWTVGRGYYASGATDYFSGYIDEVRFTKVALPPSRFLRSNSTSDFPPPAITSAPVHTTGFTGGTATFSVSATGLGNLSYAWALNGSPIPGANTATLTVSNITPASAGTYTVTVSDDFGVVSGFPATTNSASATLQVVNAPLASRAISLNFVGSSNGNWGFSPELGLILPTDTAGFMPMGNWINSSAENYIATSVAPLTLAENTGASTIATATWTSGNTWGSLLNDSEGNPVLPTDKVPNRRLLHGYIESRSTTGATVTVNDIPYASYDVYVYVAGGTTGTVGAASIDRVGSPTYYYRLIQHDTYASGTAALPVVLGAATSISGAQAAPAATFVRFAAVTGSSVTVAVKDAVLNANAGGIAAIQIVDTTPAGTLYPPVVTAAPSGALVAAGGSASLSATALSANAGTITYAWTRNGTPVGTGSTLSLSALTSADTGTYVVTITETVGAQSTSVTRSADVVVVDASRPLLINGDIGTGTVSTMAYTGALLSSGSVAKENVGTAANTWNNLVFAAGTGSLSLARESTGLALSGVTVSYTGVEGTVDDATNGAIDTTGALDAGTPVLRDLAYTDSQTTPLTLRVGGLGAFVGQRVQLVVYAIGVSTTYTSSIALNDAATISLDAANNYLSSAPAATDNSQGRDLRYTNGFVSFTGLVASDGTVAWSLGPDVDGGRIPVNGFQLLVTGENLTPAAPSGLRATAGNNQVALGWSAVSGATSYTIRRGTASGVYTTLSAGIVTGTAYTDTSAVNGTTYYYVVAAANAIGTGANSNEVSATPSNPLSALQSWRVTWFGSSDNSGNGADTFDYDGDGRSNLVEYALGSNPTVANAGEAVRVVYVAGALNLIFNHIGDSTLTYTVEASSNLQGGWTTAASYSGFATAGEQTFVDSVASGAGQPPRYLRLVVTAP